MALMGARCSTSGAKDATKSLPLITAATWRPCKRFGTGYIGGAAMSDFDLDAELKNLEIPNPDIFVGIDPGLTGAIAFVDGAGKFERVADMPTLTNTIGRRSINFNALAKELFYFPAFVLVERVGPRPGEGAVGAFSFGYGFGGICGVLSAMCLSHGLIQPAAWKRKAGIPAGAPKEASVEAALRLYPKAAPYLTRAKDHGRAEAILLAHLAWKMRDAND